MQKVLLILCDNPRVLIKKASTTVVKPVENSQYSFYNFCAINERAKPFTI